MNVANAPSPEANESSPKARSPPESSPAGIRTSSVAISPAEHIHAHHGDDRRSDLRSEQAPAGIAKDSASTGLRSAGWPPRRDRENEAIAADINIIAAHTSSESVASTRSKSPPSAGPATNAADSSPAASALVRSRRACGVRLANRPHQGGERRRADRDENEEERHQHQCRRRRAQGDPERGDQRSHVRGR